MYNNIQHKISLDFRGFIVLTMSIVCLVSSCKPENPDYFSISDSIKDRKYNIKLQIANPDSIKRQIDSIISEILLQTDVKDPKSLINKLNDYRVDSFFFEPSKNHHFVKIFELSKGFYKQTEGAFNPALFPLYEYHGAGYNPENIKSSDTLKVRHLLELTNFDSIWMAGPNLMVKKNKLSKLSYEPILYGYIVDEISGFLDKKKVRNYIIELDGKCKSHGNDKDKHPWSFGINRPEAGINTIKKELPVNISNKSIATSGAYLNVNASKGLQFASIIDPKTGQRKLSDILSATVVSNDCITADAFSTAIMTMGLEKALSFINPLKNVSACFIYDAEGDGIFEFKTSTGFARNLLNNEQKK